MFELALESRAVGADGRHALDDGHRALADATARMLDEARIRAGSHVLDVGTGTGETALLAADRVGPSGHVVATDAAPLALEATAAAVRDRGIAHVVVRTMDASTVDMRPRSFDAVIARNVLMFVPLQRAVAGFHRVLREGGRLAAVVWSTLSGNPYHRIVLEAARAHGGWAGAAPELARAFSLGDAMVYRRTLEGAGYREVAVHTVQSSRRFVSAATALDVIRASPVDAEPVLRLPDRARDAAWAEIGGALREFERDGRCEIPMESLVIVGEK
jgi:ubiquinone/menaquinone biosynthesis C-methylase UbiE